MFANWLVVSSSSYSLSTILWNPFIKFGCCLSLFSSCLVKSLRLSLTAENWEKMFLNNLFLSQECLNEKNTTSSLLELNEKHVKAMFIIIFASVFFLLNETAFCCNSFAGGNQCDHIGQIIALLATFSKHVATII